MKEIPLTKGQFAIVDDWWYEYLTQWKWRANKNRKNGNWYAVRSKKTEGGKVKFFYMHRVITRAPDGIDVDHRDRNGLNNQEENLRTCTKTQNRANTGLKSGNKSGYKGVHWSQKSAKWCAQVTYNKKCVFSEYFLSEVEAARAYDKVAKKYFGDYAYLNFQKE